MFKTIGIIGLGYVGLPLAVEFSKVKDVIGFDLDIKRLEELGCDEDSNRDITPSQIRNAAIFLTHKIEDLAKVDLFIITVPTPVDSDNKPDLSLVMSATDMVGKLIKKGTMVVYESTMAPGTTRGVCSKRLEEISGLALNKEFKVGFSPERINPGDSEHSLTDVVKIVSGSDKEALSIIGDLYEKILGDKVYRAPSMEIAEASKILENVQRDVNIALVNEVSRLLDKLKISSKEVLKAASTKWNFASYKPGLVGGHCVGVDPYYLLNLAENNKIRLPVTSAARAMNESQVPYILKKIEKHLKGKNPRSVVINILGATFKENCPDTRNSKSLELASLLKEKKYRVRIYDPYLEDSPNDVCQADVVLFTVAHEEHSGIREEDFKEISKINSLIIDIPGMLDRDMVRGSGRKYWSL